MAWCKLETRMPIYEFVCRACGRKFSALVLVRAREDEVRCPRCSGADLEKQYSRFATVKSEDARLESLGDPSSLGDLDEQDPKSVARWMKKMGQEMGEDLGDDVEQALEDDRSGGQDGDGQDGDDL
jgi:putative FmdB family regulatory protein